MSEIELLVVIAILGYARGAYLERAFVRGIPSEAILGCFVAVVALLFFALGCHRLSGILLTISIGCACTFVQTIAVGYGVHHAGRKIVFSSKDPQQQIVVDPPSKDKDS